MFVFAGCFCCLSYLASASNLCISSLVPECFASLMCLSELKSSYFPYCCCLLNVGFTSSLGLLMDGCCQSYLYKHHLSVSASNLLETGYKPLVVCENLQNKNINSLVLRFAVSLFLYWILIDLIRSRSKRA